MFVRNGDSVVVNLEYVDFIEYSGKHIYFCSSDKKSTIQWDFDYDWKAKEVYEKLLKCVNCKDLEVENVS